MAEHIHRIVELPERECWTVVRAGRGRGIAGQRRSAGPEAFGARIQPGLEIVAQPRGQRAFEPGIGTQIPPARDTVLMVRRRGPNDSLERARMDAI